MLSGKIRWSRAVQLTLRHGQLCPEHRDERGSATSSPRPAVPVLAANGSQLAPGYASGAAVLDFQEIWPLLVLGPNASLVVQHVSLWGVPPVTVAENSPYPWRAAEVLPSGFSLGGFALVLYPSVILGNGSKASAAAELTNRHPARLACQVLGTVACLWLARGPHPLHQQRQLLACPVPTPVLCSCSWIRST